VTKAGAGDSKRNALPSATEPCGSACARAHPLEPLGNLADLIGQPEQHEPVFLGQFAQPEIGHPREHAADRDHALGAAGIDQDLGVGLVEAGEDIVERLDAGRNDELRATSRRAHIEPGERGKHRRLGKRAIEQHDLAQRFGGAVQQLGNGGTLPDAKARRLRVLADILAQMRPVSEDRHAKRQPGRVIRRLVSEISLYHVPDSCP